MVMVGAAGRVVLVTGASSGIGRACAEHLAARGDRVFGAQRRVPAEGERPAGVEMLAMDVDDDSSVEAAVRAVHAQAGRLDAVVNNAGAAWMGAIEDTSIDEARAQLETNFFGALRVCRAVMPIMRAQGAGYIINISSSSLAGILGLPFSGLYSASKFALEGLSESLRLEARRFGIHVVLVEPGDFRTRLPVARRQTAASLASGVYRDAFERFKVQQDKDESAAPTPEPVARLVARILDTAKPRLRYTVGMPAQRIVVPLKRLLPQRLFQALLVRALGI
jgi:NAD(P)-dependent dehydrogenase (short-subunit alcohol dehydrogenase family)